MTFREDDSRIREGYSLKNFAMMCRTASSVVKRDTTSKRSLRRRRKNCNYESTYLKRLHFNSDDSLASRPPS